VVKHAEENANLCKQLESLFAKNQQKEEILKELQEGNKELQEGLKDARQQINAAESEIQNLKRKRTSSASPPPSQIKLLARPRADGCNSAANSTISCKDGTPYISATRE
jgi:hypothetical protein